MSGDRCKVDEIIKILICDENKDLKLKEKLLEKIFFVSAIRYPIVQKGQVILRICIMAKHRFEDIDLFIEAMKEFKKIKII